MVVTAQTSLTIIEIRVISELLGQRAPCRRNGGSLSQASSRSLTSNPMDMYFYAMLIEIGAREWLWKTIVTTPQVQPVILMRCGRNLATWTFHTFNMITEVSLNNLK